MIGLYFTTVTHGDKEIAVARKAVERIIGDSAADAVVASPNSSFMGPLTADSRDLSLLAPLPDESLDGAMLAPPNRNFRDNYGAALIAHVHNAVRGGGWVLVPFHEEKVSERTGFWNIAWLRGLLGREERLARKPEMALFRRRARLTPPPSILAAFVADAERFAGDFFADRDRAGTAAYLETCRGFLTGSAGPSCSAGPAGADIPDWKDGLEKIHAHMNYSVTGAAYKTEGLRRMIGRYLPGRNDVRVVDMGGGAGFVGVELLLTCDAVSELVNCEPAATSLPLARRLYRTFEPALNGRYRLALTAAEDFPFDEPCDVVCEFASLLYIPRPRLDETLDRAWCALRPGGILVVHENIRRPIFESKNYYEKVFTVEELEGYLAPFGPIDYYRSTDILPMTRAETKEMTVFRVIQKA